MKKFITTFLLTLTITISFSQVTISYDQSKSIDSLTSNLDKSSLTSDILYNRVTSFSKISSYNTTENNTSNRKHFEQSFSELYKASKQEKLMTVEQLRDEYTNEKHKVDIGILNTLFHTLNYNKENESLNGLSLDTIQNKFLAIPDKQAFIAHNKIIIAPLKSNAKGPAITYIFKNSLIFNINPDKNITQLTASFDTGVNYSIIQDGILISNEIPINYSVSGDKELNFEIVYDDGSTLTTKAMIYINTSVADDDPITVTAEIPFHGYEETTPLLGKLEYRVFHHTGGSTIQKPLLFIDGFDPLDKRRIIDEDSSEDSEDHKSIKELIEFYAEANVGEPAPFLHELQEKGYDVILVNHPKHDTIVGGTTIHIDGGADYIERNAMAHIKLYQNINEELAENGSTEQLVIVGPSMGGQISRYALAYMEKEYELETDPVVKEKWNHNCRLWVSVDSPHQGANIPMSMQINTYYFGYILNKEEARDKYIQKIKSNAGRQMLIKQFLTVEHPFLTDEYSSFYNEYYSNLTSNGVEGSNGYPVHEGLRKIAMVNGSITGSKNGNEAQNVMDIIAFKVLPINGGTPYNVFRNKEFYSSNTGGANQIFYGKEDKITSSNEFSVSMTNNNPKGSLDVVPGGYYNTQGQIKDEIVEKLEEQLDESWLYKIDWYEVLNFSPNHTFMPTHSTLDTNGFFNWYQPIDHDLTCSGQTPFDSYFGEPENTDHVTFTAASKEWFFQELDGEEPSPANYYEVDAEIAKILGPNVICEGETKTYTIDINDCEFPDVGVFNWSVSSNLNFEPLTDTSISVTSFGTGVFPNWISASFDSGEIITKVVVDKPYFLVDVNKKPSWSIISIQEIDELSLLQQGIDEYDIIWTKTSGPGSGTIEEIDSKSILVLNANSFEGTVEVSNSCGTTLREFTAENTSPYPYTLVIESVPGYQNRYKVIDTNYPDDIQYIEASELYDAYGIKLQDLSPDEDKINIDGSSSGTIRVIKVEVNGQMATKRVIIE